MKKAVLTTLALAAVIYATAVWSQGGPGPGGPGRGFMMSCPAMAVMPPQGMMLDRLSGALQLTKSQSAKLKQVAAKNDKTLHSLTQKAAEASKALHIAVLASKYDVRKVKDLAAKAEKAEAALVNASIDAWTQIRSVLKPDQVARLQKAMSRGPGPFGPPPGPSGFPPPPPR